MKPTNVIDMAAWRAAHAPAPVPAVSNVAEEIRMLLMSLMPKDKAKPGS